ncbi:MAG: type II secretion system protein GspG, partial [Hyphomonadaceae bacterium]
GIVDPWGHPYLYKQPGAHGKFDVSSLGADGKEEMANTRIAGDYTVADFIAEKFILRYGKAQVELRNRAWSRRPKAQPAPLPQPTRGD